ncbi:MAG: hypothetical protein QOD55_2094 [Solirubrobacteraceae bacterium]|nr:hypothetical protein [Solirubrobacteraceae bacterium]
MLRRRRTRRPPAGSASSAAPDVTVTSIVVGAGDVADPHAARAEAWTALRRIVAEALILQDAAEERLIELRDERNLAEVAPPCGDLIGRFVGLREALPSCGDPVMDRHTAALRAILDHHVLMLDSSLALLAAEWRSARLGEQLDRIDGLGAPARRLESVRAEILSRDDHQTVAGDDGRALPHRRACDP